ncbi:MAG: ABC transporter permease subunit, partial [Phycisphaerales bacterium]
LTSMVLRGRLARDAAGAASAPVRKKKRKADPSAPTDPLPIVTESKPAHAISLGKSREVGDHPVKWRELQQSPFRKPWQAWVAGATIGLFLAYLYLRIGVDEEGLHFTISVIATVAMICVAAVSTTSGISSEREGRTWDTLLTTPLSAREIIFGKFLGALNRQYFVPLLFVVQVVLAGVFSGTVGVMSLPLIAAVLVGPIALLTATGMLYSLVLKRSSAAATLNLSTAVVLFGALPALTGILMSFAQRSGAARSFVEKVFGAVMAFNPVGMMVLSLGGEMENSPMTRGNRYDFFGVGHLAKVEYLAVVLVVLAVELGATYLCLRTTAAILAERTGRRG